METAPRREFLSFGDALFLHLEREGIPINIACVAILDGDLSLDDLLPFAEAKLSHLPRCVQRVAPPPFSLGLPSLEEDPEFDFRRHVRETTLATGTESELRTLAGTLLSSNLDRAHPLWDLVLVHGLHGNRSALIARLHHSMADGLSGVAFLNALMDPHPEVPRIPPHKPRVTAAPARDPATNLIDALTSSFFVTAQRLLSAHNDLLTMARQLVHTKPGTSAPKPAPHATTPNFQDFADIFPEIASAPERLPFNVVCKGPQQFEWGEVPFETLRAMKHVHGCKFNDIALAVAASTFAKYAASRGADLAGRSIRIVVPVNTRPPHDDREGMGNEITFVPVAIPLDIADPRELVTAAHQRMTQIKQAKIAEMVTLAGALISAIPSPVQAILGPLAAQLPLTLCNLIFTNVPGPQYPLYLLGRKLLKAYPYVPIGGEMGVNCAMLTYDGTAHFGFSCDVHAVPDSHLLPQFLAQTIAEFREAFGLQEKRKTRPRVTKPRTARPKLKTRRKPVVRQAAEPAPASHPPAIPVHPQPATPEPPLTFAAAND